MALTAQARTAQNRNGAESQRARNPKGRRIPKSAESRRAPNPERRQTAPRLFSPSGIPRRLGFRAVRDFAPFGPAPFGPAPFPNSRVPFAVPCRHRCNHTKIALDTRPRHTSHNGMIKSALGSTSNYGCRLSSWRSSTETSGRRSASRRRSSVTHSGGWSRPA
jgi:hypothetical protein